MRGVASVFHRSSFAEASFPDVSWRPTSAAGITPVQPGAGGGGGIDQRRRRGGRRLQLPTLIPDTQAPIPGVPLLPQPGPAHDPLPAVPGVDPRQRKRRRRELALLVAIGVLRH